MAKDLDSVLWCIGRIGSTKASGQVTTEREKAWRDILMAISTRETSRKAKLMDEESITGPTVRSTMESGKPESKMATACGGESLGIAT